MTVAILDHLWQSTLIVILVYALTLLLRNNCASVRYWLWFTASMKFLLPFSVLAALGRVAFVHPISASSILVLSRIQPAATPFSSTPLATAPASGHSAWLVVLAGIWLLGLLSITAFWVVRWRRLLVTVRTAKPVAIDAPVPVRATPFLLEPGLVGIWSPVILLPEGIAGRLSQKEIDAILTHELCHLRRRDNLLAAAHMLVEGIFWFHPLVWLIGARLVAEREHACDEGVLASGQNAQEYAQTVLKVCRLYLCSSLACASGVSGGDLERRITAIMANRDAHEIDPGRKFLLASLGVFVVMAPLVAGGLKSVPATHFAQRFSEILSPLRHVSRETVEPNSELAFIAAPALRVNPHRLHKTVPHSTSDIRTAVLTERKIDTVMPIIIVPVPQIDASPPESQSATNDPDVIVCRPPQRLPESRLAGPQVCLSRRQWDGIRQGGLHLMPDGRTLTASYEKERSLNPRNCPASLPGASTAFLSWSAGCF